MHKNGDLSWIWEKGVAILDSSGELEYLEGLIMDFTELKKKDEQLLQVQKMETVGSLASGLAHDFNNMLGGFLGTINLLELLLLKENLKEKRKIFDYIEIAKKSTIRAKGLTDQLLMLSRKHDASLSVVDINRSIEDIVKICRNSFSKKIKINYCNSSWEAFTKADPTQLEQVILNICVNALHAMTIMREDKEAEGGELTIILKEYEVNAKTSKFYQDLLKPQKYWWIQIQDTGVGMDEETRSHIFEPFFSTKSEDKGIGLGLSMVYNIITSYNGLIIVDSEKDVGSTFNIYLPGFEEDKSGDNAESKRVVKKGSGKILLVDDEEIMLSVVEGILISLGYEVITAKTGKECIELYQQKFNEIDLVILDLSMPDMFGDEVYNELKIVRSDLKVILMSGFKESSRVNIAMTSGVNGFIQKPFSSDNLYELITTILSD